MQIKRTYQFEPIKIIQAEPAKNIPFSELLAQPANHYRKDRVMMKQIKKIFADGISLPDQEQEMMVRRDAYCLTLGITKQFLDEY